MGQLDLPSLRSLSVAVFGRQQLGAAHFATSVVVVIGKFVIVLLFYCLRSSSCRTDLSIHFQPSRPTII